MIEITAALALAPFALHSGDRLVFYGDSITEQRLYTTYTEAFLQTRYPDLHLHFYSRGWAGDSSWGGGGGDSIDRIKRDVEPLKPTVVSIMLGMNDGGYVPYDKKIEDVFREWYTKILDRLQSASPNARLTLARTCPWDQYAHKLPPGPPDMKAWAPWDGYNDVLQRFGLLVKEFASTRGGTYVDFNEPMVAVLKMAAKLDPKTAQEIIPDTIHPGPAGALLMAGELVKGWGASGIVSDVRLDAAKRTVVSVQNGTVADFDGRQWKQTDRALPFCLDPDNQAVHLVLKSSDFTDTLNRQILRIDGLKAPRYDLKIDGKTVATYTARELAKGVNLAAIQTPMRQQALAVLDLVKERNDLDFFRWRTVQRAHGDLPAAKPTSDSLDKLEEQILEKQRLAAQPKEHLFELRELSQ